MAKHPGDRFGGAPFARDESAYGVPLGGGPLLAVVVGASAGGPQAIEEVLSGLPADFPVPVAVCQHMIEGTTSLWAERLDRVCKLRASEATSGERFTAGRVYVAPAGKHMRIRGTISAPIITLERDFADVMHVPSIDFLMSSAAALFGGRLLGVLLTGMGSDGALGMLSIRRGGGVTLAQSEETAFMPSMPLSASQLGAAGEIVPLDRMAKVIGDRVAGRF
jgi:two-component system, chemotaxis family, protein-glutamate methylesterase/glutaminase